MRAGYVAQNISLQVQKGNVGIAIAGVFFFERYCDKSDAVNRVATTFRAIGNFRAGEVRAALSFRIARLAAALAVGIAKHCFALVLVADRWKTCFSLCFSLPLLWTYFLYASLRPDVTLYNGGGFPHEALIVLLERSSFYMATRYFISTAVLVLVALLVAVVVFYLLGGHIALSAPPPPPPPSHHW